jgi:WD40 repeat protein
MGLRRRAILNAGHTPVLSVICSDMSASGVVRLLDASDLSHIGDSSTNYGTVIHAMTVDDNYLYVAGAGGTIKKYELKPGLPFVSESPSYGGAIYALVEDGDYLYAGGATTQTIRKYLKSNMSYVSQTTSYGGTIRALAVYDTNLYAVGQITRRVRRYSKSDMSYLSETNLFGDAGDLGTALLVDGSQVIAYTYSSSSETDVNRRYTYPLGTIPSHNVGYGSWSWPEGLADIDATYGAATTRDDDSVAGLTRFNKSTLVYSHQISDGYGGRLTVDGGKIYYGSDTVCRKRSASDLALEATAAVTSAPYATAII